MHNGQEAIEGHQHKRVDTAIGKGLVWVCVRVRVRAARHPHSPAVACDHNHVLHKLAPQIAKRPLRQHIVRGRERHAEDDEEYVRDGQVYNQ